MTTGFYSDEIRDCYVALSPDVVDSKLQAAIAHLRVQTFSSEVESIDDFLVYIEKYPETLTTCQGDDFKSDMDKIATWREILADPETLSRTMTENYAKHKEEIDGDAWRILMFWDTPQNFEAGLQLGLAFSLLIGPIPTDEDDLSDVSDLEFLN